jgi:hypothetical protein
MKFVGCSRGDARSSAPKRDRGGIESAPIRRRLRDRVDRNSAEDRAAQVCSLPGLLTRRKRRPPVIPAPLHPVIEETAHPARDRDGSNVAPLPTQVNDCPMAFDVAESGRLSGLRVHGAEVREPQEQQVMPDLVYP